MRRGHAAEVTEQRGANHIPAAGPAGPCWACGMSRLKAGARKFSARDARAGAGFLFASPETFRYLVSPDTLDARAGLNLRLRPMRESAC